LLQEDGKVVHRLQSVLVVDPEVELLSAQCLAIIKLCLVKVLSSSLDHRNIVTS
jgi:hypothetical protein